ncbi:MAG: hypothetical protein WDN72_08105 [Alphaproteobacteria bacterium]
MAPKTAGAGGTMSVGPTSGSLLNLSDAQLADLAAASYIFGSTNAGNLTVNTAPRLRRCPGHLHQRRQYHPRRDADQELRHGDGRLPVPGERQYHQ